MKYGELFIEAKMLCRKKIAKFMSRTDTTCLDRQLKLSATISFQKMPRVVHRKIREKMNNIIYTIVNHIPRHSDVYHV